jgi:hypothetical protein
VKKVDFQKKSLLRKNMKKKQLMFLFLLGLGIAFVWWFLILPALAGCDPCPDGKCLNPYTCACSTCPETAWWFKFSACNARMTIRSLLSG